MNDRFLEELKDRTDIRDIVSKYTQLKKSGKNWMGKSPFRNERTPSFCVSPDKNLWYDFGASEGGDVIKFIEKIENMSFAESIEHLAQIAGVEVPKNFGQGGPSKEEKNDIFALHKKSADFFAAALQKQKTALKYLTDRGITSETIQAWQLGYGGDEADGLTKYLLQNGFNQQQIQESGVAFTRDSASSTMKDRFWGRVMVPIQEPRNSEIIAFSGRILDSQAEVAKYINSPENPVYHKSSTLFGLDKARNAIRDQDQVILVEGNFDVISAHQAGFTNTVATCGTSLTEDHLRVLKRLTKNIYLAFDSDLAGKKATLRATEMILKMELTPFIIEIEGGKDIDELLQKDPAKITQNIKSAQSALVFLLEKFAAKNLNKGIEGQKQFLDAFFYFLRLVPRPIEVDDFLEQIAAKLNRGKSLIEAEYKKFSAKKIDYHKPKFVEDKPVTFTREECAVGFVSLFWKKISDDEKKTLVDLLQEELPRTLFTKKVNNEPLDEAEQLQLDAWEMYQGKLYAEDFSAANIETEVKKFANFFTKELQKKTRLAQAKDLSL